MAWNDALIGSALYTTLRPFAQPLIGTVHGWFATKMVVIMLFRPYTPRYFPGTRKKLPFTPGIFPSRQRAVAQNIATTVTETLITPEDLQAKLKDWITEEGLYTAVGAIIDTVLTDLQNSDRVHALVKKVRHLAPGLLDKLNTSFIDGLVHDDKGQVAKLADWLVDEVLVPWKVSPALADSTVGILFEKLLTSETIRQGLVGALSPATNTRLEAAIREYSSGAVRFVATLVPISSALNSCQNWLRDHPQEARELIESAINDSDVRQHLVERLTGFSLGQVPLETVNELRTGLARTVQNLVATHRDELQLTLQRMEKHGMEAVLQGLLAWSPSELDPALRESIQREAAGFLYRYLTGELTTLVPRLMARLDLRTLIVDKIEAYSPQKLEGLLLGMIHRELRALELLGAVIGFFLGVIAWGVEVWFPIVHF